MTSMSKGVDAMAASLDFKTLLACLFFGNFFTVMLTLAYRSRYPKDGTSLLFLTAKILQLVIMILLLLREYREFKVVLPCIILLNLAGGTAEIFALLKMLEVYSERIKRIYYTLTGCAALALLLLYLLSPDVPRLIAAASLAGALLLIYPAYMLCWKVKKTPLQEIMGLLYGIVILSMFCNASRLVYPPPEGSPIGEWMQVFFYIGIYLLMFLGTAGFMLLSREQSYAELERAATYDELTGILNRRAFVLRARPLIAAAAKEMAPFSFLLLDVDHFKQVNDTYGHDTGDKVLRDFARRIERQLGNGDLFGRFGGEEFAVLLHRADEEASEEVAERLRRSVLDATIDGITLSYTVSIGLITIVSGERVPLNTLYKLSDTALYQAKQRGRNCVVRSHGYTARELEVHS
ncbi:diguanylate cyclase [Paenibacillus sp. LMG 31459]|uniref:Diguanylate cyclase n=2 Tax=Paenibacillus phytohabitans TaxID=2654978 RepID=A0ABX1YJW1_9BACL|nr:diguanylate cyclase [Paenibacillus phytohabitans]